MKSEQLANIYASPYTVTLVAAEGVGGQFSLPNLDNNQYVVIYVQRSIQPSTLTEDECNQLLEDIYDGDVIPEIQENIQLTLTWN